MVPLAGTPECDQRDRPPVRSVPIVAPATTALRSEPQSHQPSPICHPRGTHVPWTQPRSSTPFASTAKSPSSREPVAASVGPVPWRWPVRVPRWCVPTFTTTPPPRRPKRSSPPAAPPKGPGSTCRTEATSMHWPPASRPSVEASTSGPTSPASWWRARSSMLPKLISTAFWPST